MLAKINGVVVVGTPEEIIKYKELDSKSTEQDINKMSLIKMFEGARTYGTV